MEPRLSRSRRGGASYPCRLLERSGQAFAPSQQRDRPSGKVPRKSCLVVLRCAGVEDNSRFRHEPAFGPLTLPASRRGDGLCPL